MGVVAARGREAPDVPALDCESGADRRQRREPGDGVAAFEVPGPLAGELAGDAVQPRSLARKAAGRPERRCQGPSHSGVEEPRATCDTCIGASTYNNAQSAPFAISSALLLVAAGIEWRVLRWTPGAQVSNLSARTLTIARLSHANHTRWRHSWDTDRTVLANENIRSVSRGRGARARRCERGGRGQQDTRRRPWPRKP